MLLITIAAIGLGLATDPKPKAASAPPPETTDADKPICRRLEVTGSRIAGKRVCMTRAEWEEVGRRTRDEVGNAIWRVPGKGVR